MRRYEIRRGVSRIHSSSGELMRPSYLIALIRAHFIYCRTLTKRTQNPILFHLRAILQSQTRFQYKRA